MIWRLWGSSRCQCCQAIFKATSTAVEPLSEKKRRLRPGSPLGPAGQRAQSRSASSSAGRWRKLAKITCSSSRAWAAMAAATRGSPWPWRVTHQLLMPSIRRRPSSSSSQMPWPRRTAKGAGPRPGWLKGCQRCGCQPGVWESAMGSGHLAGVH